jgi:hypothetical protein
MSIATVRHRGIGENGLIIGGPSSDEFGLAVGSKALFDLEAAPRLFPER